MKQESYGGKDFAKMSGGSVPNLKNRNNGNGFWIPDMLGKEKLNFGLENKNQKRLVGQQNFSGYLMQKDWIVPVLRKGVCSGT